MGEIEGLRDNVLALLKERDELLAVNAALKNMVASLRIKQQPHGETCAMCGGDLKWPDGQVHAQVCLSCFGKLAQASPVR